MNGRIMTSRLPGARLSGARLPAARLLTVCLLLGVVSMCSMLSGCATPPSGQNLRLYSRDALAEVAQRHGYPERPPGSISRSGDGSAIFIDADMPSAPRVWKIAPGRTVTSTARPTEPTFFDADGGIVATLDNRSGILRFASGEVAVVPTVFGFSPGSRAYFTWSPEERIVHLFVTATPTDPRYTARFPYRPYGLYESGDALYLVSAMPPDDNGIPRQRITRFVGANSASELRPAGSVTVRADRILDIDPASPTALAERRDLSAPLSTGRTEHVLRRFLVNIQSGATAELPAAGGPDLAAPIGLFLVTDPLR